MKTGLALLAPLLLLLTAASAPASAPSGAYVVVAVRASSEVAGTLEAMREPALNGLVGRRMTFGRRVAWYDGRACASGDIRPSRDGWPHLAEPNLSDLQLNPGPTDHRLNHAMVVDCGGRAFSQITPMLVIDRRVLVMPSANGVAYIVLERPLDRRRARAVEQGLARAGFDPGPADGRIDQRTRRAAALFAQAQGADFAFQHGVFTENLVAALTRADGRR
ncbi:MAG: peptidoglycan-binding domain-containing protein [Brevundimonas sp.]